MGDITIALNDLMITGIVNGRIEINEKI